MATQIVYDGPKNAVVKFTTAGTVLPGDLSAGGPHKAACTGLTIQKIIYDVNAVADCQVLWDATADELCTVLSGRETMCFEEFGGLVNNAGAGKTGGIVVAGTGTFTVILVLNKSY